MTRRELSIKYKVVDGRHKGLEVPFPISEAPAEGEEVPWTDEWGAVVFVCIDAGRRHLRQVS